jgi:hypothetical protein
MDRIIESQPSKSLESRARRLRGIFEEQGSMEEELGFEPQNSKDDSWGANQQDEEEEADYRDLLPPHVRYAHCFLTGFCGYDAV